MHLFLMIFSRTDLRICVSRAKNCEESASDVHFCVTPQELAKKNEKRIFETENIAICFLDVEKSNVGNRLKRVLPKFRRRTGFVRGVNGHSKFDVVVDFFKIKFN